MNIQLGLRTALLLALVAAATAVLVCPGLGAASDPATQSMLMVARN